MLGHRLLKRAIGMCSDTYKGGDRMDKVSKASVDYWSLKYGRDLSKQDVFEIEQNLLGYVKWLIKMDEKLKKQQHKTKKEECNEQK